MELVLGKIKSFKCCSSNTQIEDQIKHTWQSLWSVEMLPGLRLSFGLLVATSHLNRRSGSTGKRKNWSFGTCLEFRLQLGAEHPVISAGYNFETDTHGDINDGIKGHHKKQPSCLLFWCWGLVARWQRDLNSISLHWIQHWNTDRGYMIHLGVRKRSNTQTFETT